MSNMTELANFIWSVADLLRGDYKQSEYGKVILPFTILRRLDCVLEPTKEQVLQTLAKNIPEEGRDLVIRTLTKLTFYNTSLYTFKQLVEDPANIGINLKHYVNGFSPNAQEIMNHFSFNLQVDRLEGSNLLYQVTKKFAEIDLHPNRISNHEMGTLFEELIRKFAEQSNETAGEHFTPREVIRLMVNLLFMEDREVLTKDGIVKTLYDPACGTGGMLSVAQEYLHELNPGADLQVFGQELNGETYAICKSDMMIKGANPQNIYFGNSFDNDGLKSGRFDYMLCNPPFGVEWKKVEDFVKREAESQGFAGRFGAGLPPINDGSFLFLQHMISKMKPVEQGGSRIAIVFNGSPLFTGDAGSGPSNIRRWIIENDWLEAIVALPTQLFYNTGIATYVWVVTNRKSSKRRGKVQLVNAVDFYAKMRKSLGDKRNYVPEDRIQEISRIYGDVMAGEYCKIFDNDDFGYTKVTIDRPLRLNFQTSPERFELLKSAKAYINLATSKKKGAEGKKEIEEGERLQELILFALAAMDSTTLFKNQAEFMNVLKRALAKAKLDVKPPLLNAIVSALSERDGTADVVPAGKDDWEADPELRDFESIPLKEKIEDYLAREVAPHVAEFGWEIKDVGYEIPFTRHFYKYTPLRSSSEIRREIIELEQEIQLKLKAVLGE